MIAGFAAAGSVWAYELWHWGSATWQALPFHQLLGWLHILPKNLYVWAYCSTKTGEARAAVEFCANVPESSSMLGRLVWLYLGTEAGVVVAVTTLVLAAIAMLVQPYARTVREGRPERGQWPEPPAPNPEPPADL
ncbi:MAG TPA: hypothetical protein VEC57_18825 [Candidatus Limnocylindrales bacterium]|nr:hypothetical protein [Candidatus Limnocylindrales bacterium]